jgi:hypothetical protein
MTGMNLRDAIRSWKRCGGTVEPRHRTGELVCLHPAMARKILVNGRRKDAPRILTTSLKKVGG